MLGPDKEALDPKIQDSSTSVRILECERRGVPLKKCFVIEKIRVSSYNKVVDPNNNSLGRKNGSVFHKSAGVRKKNSSLDPGAGVRALLIDKLTYSAKSMLLLPCCGSLNMGVSVKKLSSAPPPIKQTKRNKKTAKKQL